MIALRVTANVAASRLARDERVLGLSLGNEVPADVLRWYGTDVVADTIRGLVQLVREEDADQPQYQAHHGNLDTHQRGGPPAIGSHLLGHGGCRS